MDRNVKEMRSVKWLKCRICMRMILVKVIEHRRQASFISLPQQLCSKLVTYYIFK